MAHFKFTNAILHNKPIDIYNHGDMSRDFTYIDDLIEAIWLLMGKAPELPGQRETEFGGDSISDVAPYRLVNIGNSEPVKLMDFIAAIEDAIDEKAEKNFMDMQPGDVPATWADASLLKALTGYRPQVSVNDGVARFVSWYREYYGV